MKYRILLVDDDLGNLESTCALLEEWGYETDAVSNGRDALLALTQEYAVLLVDYRMPDMTGAELVAEIQKRDMTPVCLMYSCDDSREAIRLSLRAGAVDFVDKNSDPALLKETLDEAYRKYEESMPNGRVENPGASETALRLLHSIGMIGQSPALLELGRKCLVYRERKSTVLILGETGSGKELVAKGIHGDEHSSFHPVNCARFADSQLTESELFGYEKGAFTGANMRRAGIFETAGRGTVFLDEVEKLGLKAQGTLLRALREKTIRRLGASQETPIHCRILAAAKPNLLELVERREFLPDLYYRLNFLTVEVPPLREHRADILPITEHFRRKFVAEIGMERTFRPQVLRIFENYSWPGNVAELEGCVSRLVTDATGHFIEVSQLDSRFDKAFEKVQHALTLPELDARYERERRKLIDDALRSARSRRGAATRLGINESTLRSMVAKAGSVKRIFGGLK